MGYPIGYPAASELNRLTTQSKVNSMVDFNELLNADIDSFEKPAPLPVGSYEAFVKSTKFDKSQQKQTDYVRLTLGVTAAGPDVDPDQLAEFQSISNLADVELTYDYYITEKSLYRLKDDARNVFGIQGQATLAQIIEQLPSKEVTVQIAHTASKDGKTQYANVKSLLAK